MSRLWHLQLVALPTLTETTLKHTLANTLRPHRSRRPYAARCALQGDEEDLQRVTATMSRWRQSVTELPQVVELSADEADCFAWISSWLCDLSLDAVDEATSG